MRVLFKVLQKQLAANHPLGFEEERRMLLRVVIRVIQLQFLALCVYLLCEWIAGPKDAVLWFVTVSLALMMLSVCGMITRYRCR